MSSTTSTVGTIITSTSGSVSTISTSAPSTPSVSPHQSPNLSDRAQRTASSSLPRFAPPPGPATALSIQIATGIPGTPPLSPVPPSSGSPAMKPMSYSPATASGSPARSVSAGSLSTSSSSPAKQPINLFKAAMEAAKREHKSS